MKFITVKESHYVSDLIVLKSRLESDGIECRLKNELTTQVMNHIPSFLVELQVPESDLERVKQILEETGEISSEMSQPTCPKCGSDQIKLKLSLGKKVRVFFGVMVSALFMTNLSLERTFKNAGHECRRCGAEF